jgi:hypothetical protein
MKFSRRKEEEGETIKRQLLKRVVWHLLPDGIANCEFLL